MAVFEGCPVGWRGGTHRSWPGGRGGRPRALIPGEGVRLGRERLGGYHRSFLGGRGVREAGQGLGGGCKGFGSGGVGGRDTGPRDGANFATCRIFVVSNAYKKKKNGFF